MSIYRKLIFCLSMVVFLASIFNFTPVLAYVMSSTNYHIEFDSINTGGSLGTSTNYKIEDTVGEIASGSGTSTSYNIYAGYQQMSQDTLLSMTVPSSVALSPSIGGLTGGTADGQANILVSTNGSSGYSLYINSNTSPALQSPSSSFVNLITTGGIPNFTWQIPVTSSAFGFTPEGSDIISNYKDNGSSCNQAAGSDTTYRCWDFFPTSISQISQSSASNYPAFSTTTVKLRAESGTQNVQSPGTYTANLVFTAHVN